jgi:hypothetical protein
MSEEFVGRIEISDSGFVFDPKTGSTFSLNHTGLRILRLLREGRAREEIAAVMIRDFGVDLSDASRDLDDFIMSLKEFARA